MGAGGPHDDCESARKRILAVYATFTLEQNLDELFDRYVSDDLEYVNRHGTFHGHEPLLSAMRSQLENWRVEMEVERVVDAGDGALITVMKVTRLDKETGEVAWKAWPALVQRIHAGKLVFNEGYVDRRKAFAALGVEEPA